MHMPTATARPAARRARNSTDEHGSTPLLAVLCIAVAGCASGSKQATIPSDGPTMSEIYRQHMTSIGQRGSGERGRTPQRGTDESDAGSYQRAVANDIDTRFARLPNPDLVMYVAPHLSANGRYPVPGYSTVFPMYETVEYAMPGEVPWRRLREVPAARIETAASPAAPRSRAAIPSGHEK
jgi:conjugative transfer region lipoprotein (TIGR03751 family)